MSMDLEYEPEFDEYIEEFIPEVMGLTTEQMEVLKGTLKDEETIKLNQKIFFKTMFYEWMKRINPECFDEGGEPLYSQADEEYDEDDGDHGDYGDEVWTGETPDENKDPFAHNSDIEWTGEMPDDEKSPFAPDDEDDNFGGGDEDDEGEDDEDDDDYDDEDENEDEDENDDFPPYYDALPAVNHTLCLTAAIKKQNDQFPSHKTQIPKIISRNIALEFMHSR